MRDPRVVALFASVGSLLQGWDNAACAGALLYLRPEFDLDSNPTAEGLIVAMPLIGAMAASTIAGSTADSVGRKPVLIASGIIYIFGGSIMFWSPSMFVLLVARFVLGTGIGLAIAVIPILISETAPSEIRGQLNTLPYFLLSIGLVLEYCFVFGLTIMGDSSWRMILGLITFPALIYLALAVFYLPESPRWLVSAWRVEEAKAALQQLRGPDVDVSAELALLVEGLGVGAASASLEEWIVKPAEMAEMLDPASVDDGKIMLFGPGGPEQDVAWVAQPVVDEAGNPLLVPQRSAEHLMLVNDMVSFFGDIQPEAEMALEALNNDDLEKRIDDELGPSEAVYGNSGDLLQDDEDVPDHVGEGFTSPLLWKRTESRGNVGPRRNASAMSQQSSFMGLSSRASSRTVDDIFGEKVGSFGIGGGWQLAWRADDEHNKYERVYLRQEGADLSRYGSHRSLPSVQSSAFGTEGGEAFPAMAMVGPSMQWKDGVDSAGVPAVKIPESAKKNSLWKELLEPGVRRALLVGMGVQGLQQLCGVSAVLYYTPSILQQSGFDSVADALNLSADSASILASLLTTLLMVPCLVVAMRLVDQAGRRALLLATIPVLTAALILVILANTVFPAGSLQGVGSFLGVAIYICVFVMGFGPIPNVLASEIFPTRVRGVCISMTCFLMWVCNIITSVTFPTVNSAVGLPGAFTFFACMCLLSWVFVYLRVPETKGLPLEIISEFFAMASQPAPSREHDSSSNNEKPGALV